MKLRANVEKTKIIHKTRHGVGTIQDGNPVWLAQLPDPESLVLLDQSSGFSMLYMDSNNEVITDGWHATLADAMKQAEFEFGITTEDWLPID